MCHVTSVLANRNCALPTFTRMVSIIHDINVPANVYTYTHDNNKPATVRLTLKNTQKPSQLQQNSNCQHMTRSSST